MYIVSNNMANHWFLNFVGLSWLITQYIDIFSLVLTRIIWWMFSWFEFYQILIRYGVVYCIIYHKISESQKVVEQWTWKKYEWLDFSLWSNADNLTLYHPRWWKYLYFLALTLPPHFEVFFINFTVKSQKLIMKQRN